MMGVFVYTVGLVSNLLYRLLEELEARVYFLVRVEDTMWIKYFLDFRKYFEHRR